MDELTVRKIAAVVGTFVAAVTLNPATNAIADLHGHTTRAAIWITFFIVGMIVAWTSTMGPGSYQMPKVNAAKPAEKPAAIAQKPASRANKGRKTSGFAIASFILSLVFIIPIVGFFASILAVIFGFLALNQIKKENLQGRGFAISGIVIGFFVLFIYAMIILAAFVRMVAVQ